MNSRGKAAEIVGAWLESGDFPDRMIGDIPDRAFVMELVYGICRWQRTLEWLIGKCASRKPEKDVMAFLLVGAYQLMKLDHVTEYAALNETVQAVKDSRSAHASGFVNGVLRQIQRTRASLETELAGQAIAVRESHPDELVKKWTGSFGSERTLALCQWNNSRPGIDIRVNLTKTSMPDFLKLLKAREIDAVPHPYAPDAFLSIPHGTKVSDLPGYDEGLFYVQDPSTAVAVEMLDPQPGDYILDACAAPGGKAMYICEKMNGSGKLVAMDLHGDRLELFMENVQRMQLDIIDVVIGDARSKRDFELITQGALFDRILLDVPCSNTGVLRRRPDARWRFNGRMQGNLTGCQEGILTNCARYIRPEGSIVYSTCSLEPEEDEQLIGNWLNKNPHFELVNSTKLFPTETSTDGVYAALLRRMK